MNQRNNFSASSVVLILQGIAFYALKSQIASTAFPAVDATGQVALSQLIEVMSALSILIGLVTWVNRTTAGVVGAFTIGTLVLLAVTLKHYFVDKINVPIPAIAVQVLIVLACAYLLMSKKENISQGAVR